MRLLCLLLLVSGCSLFGNGGVGPNSQTEPRTREQLENLDVTLVSRCDKPIRVCVGVEKCMALVRDKPRHLRASTHGTGEVFVSLEGSTVNVSANETFNTVELDETCAHLGRKLATR